MKFSLQYLTECFTCDTAVGVLFWRNRPAHHFPTKHAAGAWNTRYAGREAGWTCQDGYSATTIAGRSVKSHMIVWALHHGEWPTSMLDHRDRNRKNNAIENLRPCTKAENSHNMNSARPNKCGLKGVRTSGSKFTAQISVNNKRLHLGSFALAADAHLAYQVAAKKYHGEFANFGDKNEQQ